MKIIQSFWSGQNNVIQDNRGWLSYEYHWLGWILSCNQLRKFYDEVELYTDSFGYEILIEKLNLPYTKVHVVLDEMNQYPKEFWAIAKIKTYELQDTPFLHVDGDVFIWQPFPKQLLKKSLIVQNLESSTEYYQKMWSLISSQLSFIPKEIYNYNTEIANLGCNMGIFGGNDIDFLKKYTSKSFEFVDKNKENWSKINNLDFNIFFEQQLFYEMSRLEKKKISCLFTEIWGENSYLGLGNFYDVPHQRFFLHLLGVFKRKENLCDFLEKFVLKEYPDFFLKLKKILPEKYDFYDNFLSDYEFSKKSNEKFVSDFKEDIFKERIEINNRSLFARDLYLTTIFEKFDNYIVNDIDFYLFLLPCFEVLNENTDNQENQNLKVMQYDGTFIYHDLDEIDKLIIDELSKNKTIIKKEDFRKNMYKYLDDDFSKEDLIDFDNLLRHRLRYFLICKILVVF